MASNDKVFIFDTTLRDGEQCPGASMNLHEKIKIAKALEELGVDIIEAGFAVSSKGDFESVKSIAKEIKNSTVCSLARSVEKDINAAHEALSIAKSFRIHTFIATSDIHMQYKLKMEPEKVIEKAVKAVSLARNYTDDVEFSCEDAGRSEVEFLSKICEKVISAGATTINLPDTVGYTMPHEYGQLIKSVIENTANSDKAVFSTHCHNDLGLAVANSLSGILNNARQIECTINGIGERAGNASLEEIVMAIRTRKDIFGCDTNINTKHLVACSELVSKTINFPVPPNKAIVGKNAFAHEAGIHQDGILKNRQTYEIMTAEDVGWKSNEFVLGKHSGHNAFKDKLDHLGIKLISDKALEAAFERFKDIADRDKFVSDDMLIQIANAVNKEF